MAKVKLSKLQQAYREFFKALMDEYEVKSPVQLGDKRSEFFNRIKKEWPAAKKKIKEGVIRQEIREMIVEVLEDKNINEATDPIIAKVGEIAKDNALMSMRKPLEAIFKKKDIDFVMSPVAHFRIKHGGKTLVIVNKKYADDAELVVGDKAIGYEGKI